MRTEISFEHVSSFAEDSAGRSRWNIWKTVEGCNQRVDGAIWREVLLHTKEWAEEIRKPNFWVDLGSAKEILTRALNKSADNSPFTLGEQAEVAARLQAIQAYVEKTYELSREQIKVVQDGFKEAESASKRIGRKDFVLLFGGTLLSLIVSGALTPEMVQHVLLVTMHGIEHIFGHEMPSPLRIPRA
jgi:hypothetical protein